MAYQEVIYAYWDAKQIYDVLNAVAMITGGDNYIGLLKVFAIIGLFVAVATGFAKARGEDAVVYIVILSIFYGILLVPKRDVVIWDTAKNSGVYTVSGVPLGLAFFASAESHIGHWLTKTYETAFSLPNDLKFQKNGMMFGAKVAQERAKIQITNPYTFRNMQAYMRDCAWPEFIHSPGVVEILMKSSTDMWADLGSITNPARFTNQYNSTNTFQIMTCLDAYTGLTARLNQEANHDAQVWLARKLNPEYKGNSMDDATLKALLANQMGQADATILQISRTASETIKQALMVNVFRDSAVTVPQSVNDYGSAQQALAAIQAAEAANLSYITMAKLGESTLPLVRTAIHLMILGLFPIVMVLIIMAGVKGGMVLRYYLMAILWVNLWAPLYAVINYMATGFVSDNVVAAAGGHNVETFRAHTAVVHSLISDQGIVGMLSLSVPAIAWMLCSISAASVTGVVSGIMTPASSSAQQAGSSVSKGDVSGGNVNWGNVSMGNFGWKNTTANQMKAAPTAEYGASSETQRMSNGAEVTSFPSGGGKTLNMTPTTDNLGTLSIGSSTNAQRIASEMSSDAASKAASHTSGMVASLTSARNDAQEWMKSFSKGSAMQKTDAYQKASGLTNAVDDMLSIASKWDAGINATTQEKAAMLASASAGVGLPKAAEFILPVRVSAGTEARTETSSSSEDLYRQAKEFADKSGFSTKMQEAIDYSRQIQSSSGQRSDTSLSNKVGSSLSDALQHSDQQQLALQQAQTYQQASQRIDTLGGDAQVQLSQRAVDILGGEEMASHIIPKMSDEQKLQFGNAVARQFVDDLASDNNRELGFINQGMASDQNSGIAKEATEGTPSLTQPVDNSSVAGRQAVEGHHAENKVAVNVNQTPSVETPTGTETSQSLAGKVDETNRVIGNQVNVGKQEVVKEGDSLAGKVGHEVNNGGDLRDVEVFTDGSKTNPANEPYKR